MVEPEVSTVIPRRDREIPVGAVIHPAVHERLGKEVELRGIDGEPKPKTNYRPVNLPA